MPSHYISATKVSDNKCYNSVAQLNAKLIVMHTELNRFKLAVV